MATTQEQILENLNLARLRISAKLAEISANPRPNYMLDGQMFNHSEYFAMLTNRLDDLDRAAQRRGKLQFVWLGEPVITGVDLLTGGLA